VEVHEDVIDPMKIGSQIMLFLYGGGFQAWENGLSAYHAIVIMRGLSSIDFQRLVSGRGVKM
jgi:hypothetical protein